MAFTLDSVGQRHTLYRDAQTGLYRAELAIHDQRYDTGSGLAAVVEALETDGTEGFALRANRLRHAVRLGNDGARRWYPRRNVLTEYVEFGRPEYWTGADWQPLVLGTPVQPDPGSLLWVKPAYAVQLTLNWRRLKMDLRLKTSAAARRVRWPVALNNLGWSDWSLLGQDGTTVGRIDRPTAEDANGVAVPLTVQYAGGYVSVLANLTGATYPVVIDPTFTSQPDATAGVDTWLDQANPTTNKATEQHCYATLFAAGRILREVITFDLSSIPSGANPTSSTLTLTPIANHTAPTVNVHRILSGNSGWTESATWNTKDGAAAWAGSAGCGTIDTDYASTVMGSGFGGSVTAGTAVNVSLNLAEIATIIANNYGLLLKASDESTINNAQNFASSDYATPTYRPKLVIEYSTGNPYYAYAQQ